MSDNHDEPQANWPGDQQQEALPPDPNFQDPGPAPAASQSFKPSVSLQWDNDAQCVAITVQNCRTFDIQLVMLDCARRVIEDQMNIARMQQRQMQAMQAAQNQAIAQQLAGKNLPMQRKIHH